MEEEPVIKKPTFIESVVEATQEVTAKDWYWIGTDLIIIIYAVFIMLPMFKLVARAKPWKF